MRRNSKPPQITKFSVHKSSPPSSAATTTTKHGGSKSAMRSLSIKQITANRAVLPLNRSLFPIHFSLYTTMADNNNEAKKKSQSGGDDKQETEKSLEEIPPPPEKPLPGDCCGSGCVRCVWDVYYEELEEYNNLYKNKSDPIKPS